MMIFVLDAWIKVFLIYPARRKVFLRVERMIDLRPFQALGKHKSFYQGQ